METALDLSFKFPVEETTSGLKRGRGRPRKDSQYYSDIQDSEDLVVKKLPQTYSGKRKRSYHNSAEGGDNDDAYDDEIDDDDDGFADFVVETVHDKKEYSPKTEVTLPKGRDQPKRSTRGKHSKYDSDYIFGKIKHEMDIDDEVKRSPTKGGLQSNSEVKMDGIGVEKRKRGRPKKSAHITGNDAKDTGVNEAEKSISITEVKERLTADKVKESLVALKSQLVEVKEMNSSDGNERALTTAVIIREVGTAQQSNTGASSDNVVTGENVVETGSEELFGQTKTDGTEKSTLVIISEKDKTDSDMLGKSENQINHKNDGEEGIENTEVETNTSNTKPVIESAADAAVEESLLADSSELVVLEKGKVGEVYIGNDNKGTNEIGDTEVEKNNIKTNETVIVTSEGVVENKEKMKSAPATSDKGSMVIMFEETKDGKYGCVLCNKKFTEEIDAISHFMDHNQKGAGVCENCGTEFPTLNELLVHRKSCLKEKLNSKEGESHETTQAEFACEICMQTFKSAAYLYRHMVMHTDTYTCCKCKKTFSRKDSLQKHILKCCPEQAENYGIYYCEICLRVFSKQGGLQRHKVKCKLVQCEKCKKTFASLEDCNIHKCQPNFEEDTARYACGQCSKKFQSMYYLNQHRKMHSSEHSCQRCGRNYANKEDLDLHVSLCETLENIRLYGNGQCSQCFATFSNTKQFREHSMTHTHPFHCSKCDKRFIKIGSLKCHDCFVTTFSCDTCQKTFRNKATLEKHVNEHECLQYQCSSCLKLFHLKSQAKDHVQVCEIKIEGQGEEKGQIVKRKQVNEVCETCGKSFTSKSNLTKHMLLHGEKKFACYHCDKRFHLDVYLREHITCVHYNIFKYQCNSCGQLMKSKTGLILHDRIFHSKDGVTYPCPKCDKVFKQKGNMRAHMYSHTTERKFACDICMRAFKYPDQLSRHKKEHKPNLRLSCQMCQRQFVRGYELKRHMQTEHSGCVYVCNLCSARCCQRHTMVRHFKRKHPNDVHLLSKEGYIKSMLKHVSTLGDSGTVDKSPKITLHNPQESGDSLLLGGSGVAQDVGTVEQNIIVPQDSYIIQNPEFQAQPVSGADSNSVTASEPLESSVGMVRNEDGTISLSGVQAFPHALEGLNAGEGQIVILQIVDPDSQEQTIQTFQDMGSLPNGVKVLSEVNVDGEPVPGQIIQQTQEVALHSGEVTQTELTGVEQAGEIIQHVGEVEIVPTEFIPNVGQIVRADGQVVEAGQVIEDDEQIIHEGQVVQGEGQVIEEETNEHFGNLVINEQLDTVLIPKAKNIQQVSVHNVSELVGNKKIKIMPIKAFGMPNEEQTTHTQMEFVTSQEGIHDDLQPIPECIASTETVQLTESVSTS